MRPGSPLILDSRVCSSCLVRFEALAPQELLPALATPPSLPSDLRRTHEVCASCLNVYRADAGHDAVCLLRLASVTLTAAGWSSGITEALRADLRARSPRATLLWVRVFRILLSPYLIHGGLVIVPVPMSNSLGSRDLAFVARQVADELSIPILDALQRRKRSSTRASVAQRREAIVREEYSIVDSRADQLRGHDIMLLDDVATTGHTVTGLARILKTAGARHVLPVVLDRTVSPRLLQRLPARAPDHCPHR